MPVIPTEPPALLLFTNLKGDIYLITYINTLIESTEGTILLLLH